MNTQRAIKFRAWDKLEKRFFYPDKGYQGHFVLTLNGQFQNLQNGSGGDEYIVQQWTGLKDSKGNEVWEGDIIKYTRLIEKERRIVELFSYIKYQDAKFGFDLTGFNDMFFDLSDESDFEVIGNIFENSEFLNNEK